MIRYLKIKPEYFEAVQSGIKTFECRLNDKSYKIGDILVLREYSNDRYTGRYTIRRVSYVLTDCMKGVCSGYVIMSLGLCLDSILELEL